MAEAVNMKLAWGATEKVAGLADNRIYSLGLGHQCPRCLDIPNVKSGPEYLLLEKKLCDNDIIESHGIYIRREDEPKVPKVNFPSFNESMQLKAMQFHRGDKYYLRGKGWKKFAREKMLDIGDTVKIFALRCQSCEEIRGCMIKVYKKVNALTFDVHG